LNQVYSRRSKTTDVAVLVSLSLAMFCASARIGLVPRDSADGVAVIFAPWTAAETALERSVADGGRILRFGSYPFIVVVMPDRADYADRMLDAGAWLVVDPKTLAACSTALSRIRIGI
jgi:hypothetical protein